jgi:hypothetical protein
MMDTRVNGGEWSLERAIASQLIAPPPITFLSRHLDMHLFHAALPALRRAWTQLAEET